jgi:hypothetical protein
MNPAEELDSAARVLAELASGERLGEAIESTWIFDIPRILAEPLANWLRREAKWTATVGGGSPRDLHALAVAREINRAAS